MIRQLTVHGGRIYVDVYCVNCSCVYQSSLCVEDCVYVSLVSAIIYFEYYFGDVEVAQCSFVTVGDSSVADRLLQSVTRPRLPGFAGHQHA